jgi:hypothetical protein
MFDNRVIPVSEKVPRPRQWVIVVTPSYRCMGFLDDKGTWRDAHRSEVIEGVQAWISATEDETAASENASINAPTPRSQSCQ